MPITLRKINAQVKDPTTGNMIPAGILSSDSLATIATAENSAITRITNEKTLAINEITQLFPSAPAGNGTYNLQCIVNDGAVTYQWTLIT